MGLLGYSQMKVGVDSMVKWGNTRLRVALVLDTGWGSDSSKIDDREKLTCANVKAAGFTLYTIRVKTSGDPMSTLLQSCASGLDKFWMLTTAS